MVVNWVKPIIQNGKFIVSEISLLNENATSACDRLKSFNSIHLFSGIESLGI